MIQVIETKLFTFIFTINDTKSHLHVLLFVLKLFIKTNAISYKVGMHKSLKIFPVRFICKI